MTDFAFTTFNRGIFSPNMAGRVEYKGALAECLNFIPTVQGPVVRRGGTRFLSAAEDGRLFAFVYSAKVAYILLFAGNKIKIWKDRAFNAQIESPYPLADVKDGLYLYQQADVVFICHPKHRPRRLIRTGEAAWGLKEVEFIDGPFLPNNTTDITLTVSGNNVTASGAVFAPGDVGRQIRIGILAGASISWGWGVITGYTSATAVTVQGKGNWTNGTTKIWALGAFSETTGYPSSAAFLEQRMFYGFRNFVFGSKTGAADTFSVTNTDGTVDDDSALFLPLEMEKADLINWMIADNGILVCGTSSQTYTIRTTDDGVALTQRTARGRKDNEQGSDKTRPVSVAESFLFASQFSKKLLSYSFSYESYRYRSSGISVFAEDLLQKGIREMAFAREPQPVLWIVIKNGDLVGCTISAENGVFAFHRHDVSGYVVSAAVIPDRTAERDELYMLVRRKVNQEEVLYLEVMEPGLSDEADDTIDAFFVDCGVTRTFEAAAAEITGLSHLEGKTVAVLADGAVQPDRVVENGKITLQEKARVVHVGIGYVSAVQPTAVSVADAVLENRKKKIVSMDIRLHRTVGLFVGIGKSMDPVFFGTGHVFNQAVSLFSGDKNVPFPAGWDRDVSFRIEQRQPLPCSVLAVFFKMNVGG